MSGNGARWAEFRVGALGEVRAQLAREDLTPRSRVGAVMRVLSNRLTLGCNQGLFQQQGPVTDETLDGVEKSLLEHKGNAEAVERITMDFLDRYFIGLDKAMGAGPQPQASA